MLVLTRVIMVHSGGCNADCERKCKSTSLSLFHSASFFNLSVSKTSSSTKNADLVVSGCRHGREENNRGMWSMTLGVKSGTVRRGSNKGVELHFHFVSFQHRIHLDPCKCDQAGRLCIQLGPELGQTGQKPGQGNRGE